MKVTDDSGNELPRDGKTFGHLKVRGVSTVGRYLKGDGGDILDKDGYFDTGDIATLDRHGVMQITDRSKDVIKSGGEWISSIEVENAAVGAEGVAEAAVIGVAHEKWGERPLLVCVASDASRPPARDAVLRHVATRVVRWWVPEDVVFVESLPHTATGKLDKKALRAALKDYVARPPAKL